MLELKPVPLDEKAYALLKNLGTTHEGKTVVFPTTLIYCNEALEALYVESTKNLRELHEELLEELWIKEATSIVIIPCQTMIDADFYKLVCILQFKPKYQKLNELEKDEKFLNYKDTPVVPRMHVEDISAKAYSAYFDDLYKFMYPNYVSVKELPSDIPEVFRVHDISHSYKTKLLKGKEEIDLRKAKLMKDVNSSIEKLHKLNVIPEGNHSGVLYDDNGKEIKYRVRNGILELKK